MSLFLEIKNNPPKFSKPLIIRIVEPNLKSLTTSAELKSIAQLKSKQNKHKNGTNLSFTRLFVAKPKA